MNTVHPAVRAAALAFAFVALNAATLFTQNASPVGTTDFPKLLSGVPMPPVNTAEAGRRSYGADLRNPDYQALDQFYQAFTNQVEQVVEKYEIYQRNRSTAYYSTQNEATMRAQTVALADQNPILAGMGGAEKVAQMTPEQAEAAARQSAAAYMADPFAANGVQSAGMTALYQKIISDPAYAQKFEKMSDKEREAELRKYMANDKPVTENAAQKQAQLEYSNKVAANIAIQQYYTALVQQIQDANTQFANRQLALLNLPGNHTEIEAEYQAQYARIPEIVLGEGREKDPELAQKLRKTFAARHLTFAAQVLQQSLLALEDLKTEYLRIAAEHSIFIQEHRHELNANMADQLSGAESETAAIQCELTVAGLAGSLMDQAKEITREAARWELNAAQ